MKKTIKEFIAIGDGAGRFDEMMELISLFPKCHVICVGDPNDRGPKSRQIIEYFMGDQENRTLIQSNHSHLMIDFYENLGTYHPCDPFANGFETTVKSYGLELPKKLVSDCRIIVRGLYSEWFLKEVISEVEVWRKNIKDFIPQSHIDFLKTCPMYLETDDTIITHAAINPTLPLPVSDIMPLGTKYNARAVDFLWNVGSTRRRNKFQIHGHASYKRCMELADSRGLYGMNVDSSKGDVLSAIHWPSEDIKSVPYKSMSKDLK